MKCVELPGVFSYQLGSLPFGEITVVGEKDGGFRTLVRCIECGQHWQLDGEERHGVALAIRVHYPEEWEFSSDYAPRMTYLVKSHGGDSDQKCAEPDCRSMSIRGFNRCAIHMAESW